MSCKRKKKNHSSLFLVFRNSQEKKKKTKTKSELIPLVIRNVVDLLTRHPQPLIAPASHLSCFTRAASHSQISSNKTEQRIRILDI